MNITGSLPVNQNQIFDPSGAFTRTSGESYTHTNSTTSEGTRAVGFNAANSWSGSTSSEGSHSHSVTVNATGGGAAHSNMQPYLSVYMWKRTA
jgi:microcystin-dependent protein